MTKFSNKFKRPCFWPILGLFSQFLAQKKFKIFLENLALSCTTSYGFLAPCQNLEKVNDTIQRKCPDRRKNEWKDGQKATTGGPKRNNASKNLSNGINLCWRKKVQN